jgi:hypothetical protein
MRALNFRWLWGMGTLGLALVSGCGPAVKTEDLGTVVWKVPDVPGSDAPYRLRGLGDVAAPDSKQPPAGN